MEAMSKNSFSAETGIDFKRTNMHTHPHTHLCHRVDEHVLLTFVDISRLN